MSGWQPIETHPCPAGVRVLVSYEYRQGNWARGVEIKERCSDGTFVWPSKWYHVTHWMPLPDPPVSP